jgi:hypothetical protein
LISRCHVALDKPQEEESVAYKKNEAADKTIDKVDEIFNKKLLRSGSTMPSL